MNCVDYIAPNVFGYAGKVVEEDFKGTKYMFFDEVKDPKSVTIVVSGTTEYNSEVTKVAVRSRLCALKKAYKDGKILPGAGATEITLNVRLNEIKRQWSRRIELDSKCLQRCYWQY